MRLDVVPCPKCSTWLCECEREPGSYPRRYELHCPKCDDLVPRAWLAKSNASTGQAGGGDRIAALEKALEPFAAIALYRDFRPDGIDMIDAPDLAITPDQIRKARSLLPPQTSTRDGRKESV